MQCKWSEVWLHDLHDIVIHCCCLSPGLAFSEQLCSRVHKGNPILKFSKLGVFGSLFWKPFGSLPKPFPNFSHHAICWFLPLSHPEVGDSIWQAADARARGFLIGATYGRTTLNGEGLQHQARLNTGMTGMTWPSMHSVLRPKAFQSLNSGRMGTLCSLPWLALLPVCIDGLSGMGTLLKHVLHQHCWNMYCINTTHYYHAKSISSYLLRTRYVVGCSSLNVVPSLGLEDFWVFIPSPRMIR